MFFIECSLNEKNDSITDINDFVYYKDNTKNKDQNKIIQLFKE